MGFANKYTTEELKAKDAEKEKNKIVVSNDTYAKCEMMAELAFRISRIK